MEMIDRNLRAARGLIANRNTITHWRMDPRTCAFITCNWSREDTDTLRLLCGSCIDAPEDIVQGSTRANYSNEPLAIGVPR
jgi:hypothetical protein